MLGMHLGMHGGLDGGLLGSSGLTDSTGIPWHCRVSLYI